MKRTKLTRNELIGQQFLPNNGAGITAQDLLELLQSVPPRVRQNYIMIDGVDVTGISFAQSDQAEPWEFKVYITIDRTQERIG
jgi:hypothetical protein